MRQLTTDSKYPANALQVIVGHAGVFHGFPVNRIDELRVLRRCLSLREQGVIRGIVRADIRSTLLRLMSL
ncbi:hypothetical protein GQ57_07605 [Burkholderia sp. MSh2]|nr:hypothetical protein GQ57_07605 [Burkholderia sp. MSh2]